jgi:hypothetical protein
MAIKLKVGNVLGAFQSGALARLANSNLPIKTAAQLKRVLEQSQKAHKEYEAERLAVCEEFGKLNAETGDYEFLNEEGELDKERLEAFQLAGAELLQKDLTFDGKPFGISQFYSSQSITANDLMILEWLIDVPVEAEAKEPEASESTATGS